MTGTRRQCQPPIGRHGSGAAFPVGASAIPQSSSARTSAHHELPGQRLNHQVFLAGDAAFADAADLIERYGMNACEEAKLRASRSRDLGNVIHFCHWREIERMIGAMRPEGASGPLQ
jgi:hypothetical protein